MKKLAQSPAHKKHSISCRFFNIKISGVQSRRGHVVHLSFWRTEETKGQTDEVNSHFT